MSRRRSVAAGARYDRIGTSYARTRREDPRIAATIFESLGPGRTIVNIGAGTGSYEPTDRTVVAVEPSVQMLAQRPIGSSPAVRGVAEALPFGDLAFDVAVAILTVHHWNAPAGGLVEMRRVAQRQLVLFFEPLRDRGFWGLEYFPEAADLDTERDPLGERLVRDVLDVQRVVPVLIPHDCRDGFGTAFWARPEAYLDADVRAGMSWLSMLPRRAVSAGVQRLRLDLRSGEWDRRFGHLRGQDSYDGGFRLAVAGS
ncbi:class I SAM-dependent methyltransferase [Iamia sp. SCSIO 61187]|uniref:class I SAM-dependent methyltransferase n=1 Tax=Iamia sp. SCSIO 61187 TaxID=2722752 RepID=UPI001C62E9F8|nr:methyltransferase domain-containing protein [Iamia sp. SCSIO 61187]QYG91732.1 class I SAM-dependent methyltransferase [Iamia sp. SCSIO 61187]